MLNKRQRTMMPAQVLTLGFAIIIIIGTVLLMLPAASAAGQWTGSAHCVVYGDNVRMCNRTGYGTDLQPLVCSGAMDHSAPGRAWGAGVHDLRDHGDPGGRT